MRKICFLLFLALSAASCQTAQTTADNSSEDSRKNPGLTEQQEQLFASLFFNASREKIIGNYDKALALFEKALELKPQSDATLYEMARIYIEKDNLSKAGNLAQRAYSLDRQNIWYANLLSELYMETQQLDKAALLLEEVVANHPEQIEFQFQLAGIYAAMGKFDKALAMYNQIEETGGFEEAVATQRQLIFLEQQKYPEALEQVQALIKHNPGEIKYMGMLAEIYEHMGESDKAYSTYLSMKELEPDNGLIHLSLAEYYRKRGDLDNTITSLKRAFETEDLNIDVKVNILLGYLSDPSYSKYLEDALELSEILEKTHPESAKSFAIHGDILISLERYSEARDKFREALERDPSRAPIWQQLLTLDSRLNDFDTMAEDSEKALELFPNQPVFYLFNAIALLQKEKPMEAINILNAGKGLIIDNPGLLAQFDASLGDAYHAAGNWEKSDAAYEKSLNQNPNNPIVLNNYSYYLALRGEKLEKAEKMAKLANDLSPNDPSLQDTYAWVLYKRENYQNALFWLQEALKNGGDTDPTIHDHLGDVLLKLGRAAEAIESWQTAIKLGGDDSSLNSKIANAKTFK